MSGLNFGRWLYKTQCNYMIVHGMEPNPAYIRYAFLRSPGKPLFFHLAGSLGHPLRLADGRDPVVSWIQQLSPDEPGFDGFSVSLAGFETLVATVPIMHNGQQMVDRVHVLERRTPLGPFRITLDWSGEPPITPHVA